MPTEAVCDRHTVHSFDHVAIIDNVVACDVTHVPLDDETLDVAIFSPSLMGANFTDYIREAHRTLKLDDQLHVIEATERFTDREQVVRALKDLGFKGIDAEDVWKFTHVQARKSDRPARQGIERSSDAADYASRQARSPTSPDHLAGEVGSALPIPDDLTVF
jgi:hypothetical protein